MASADSTRLGGPVFRLLGCVNLGSSSHFSGESPGLPVDSALLGFFSVLVF